VSEPWPPNGCSPWVRLPLHDFRRELPPLVQSLRYGALCAVDATIKSIEDQTCCPVTFLRSSPEVDAVRARDAISWKNVMRRNVTMNVENTRRRPSDAAGDRLRRPVGWETERYAWPKLPRPSSTLPAGDQASIHEEHWRCRWSKCSIASLLAGNETTITTGSSGDSLGRHRHSSGFMALIAATPCANKRSTVTSSAPRQKRICGAAYCSLPWPVVPAGRSSADLRTTGG
jgi:hypothetical protein